MSEVKLASDTARPVRHSHKGVDLRIIPKGNEGATVPIEVLIIAEGPNEKVTWRPLEAMNYNDAIEEAKIYANEWVDAGMPSSGYYRPLDLDK